MLKRITGENELWLIFCDKEMIWSICHIYLFFNFSCIQIVFSFFILYAAALQMDSRCIQHLISHPWLNSFCFHIHCKWSTVSSFLPRRLFMQARVDENLICGHFYHFLDCITWFLFNIWNFEQNAFLSNSWLPNIYLVVFIVSPINGLKWAFFFPFQLQLHKLVESRRLMCDECSISNQIRVVGLYTLLLMIGYQQKKTKKGLKITKARKI